MPSRSTWRGFLKLSLVSCPIGMTPVVRPAARVSFHNLNPETHNRVEMRPHDSVTGAELDDEDLVKGYEFEKGRFVTVEDEELDELEMESSHTIELDRFVEPEAIDLHYYDAPYFIAPDGKAADETFRVIHAALVRENKIGVGRVVLGRRERMVALRTRGKGMALTTLRAANEVRAADDYFADIDAAKPDPAKLRLAEQIIDQRTAAFDPAKFEDRYEAALRDLVEAKRTGKQPEAPKPTQAAPVIDLMAALKRSLQSKGEAAPTPAKKGGSRSAKHAGRGTQKHRKRA